jgi:hypothetical protein
VDRNQAAYLFATEGNGIFQELNAKYEADATYVLAVGMVGSSSIPPTENTPLSIAFYFRDAENQIVPIIKRKILYTAQNFPNFTRFRDFAVATPLTAPTDPWFGKNIGIMIFSEAGGAEPSGGVWDVENVRVTVAPPLMLRIALGQGLGLVHITWDSLPNTSYVLQRTTDFITWAPFLPEVQGDGNPVTMSVSIDEPSYGFFRVIPTPTLP